MLIIFSLSSHLDISKSVIRRRYTLDHPIRIILVCSAVFILSLGSSVFIKKTFYPEPNFGEFIVEIETPPGTSLEGTLDTVKKIY
ncbi:MAG: hypothetical protein MUD12_05585 [Spirochaetes bacterium]|nr:hypothetical protein [Spirochaetota bacterium]